MGETPDNTDDDLSRYDPILLRVGIRAPMAKVTPQTSPASKSTLRKFRGDALIFGRPKNNQRKSDARR